MNRLSLPKILDEARIIAVIRGLSPERAVDAAHAVLSGGVSAIEVTMDSPHVHQTIESLASSGVLVGAGTVLSQEDGMSAADSGATFLVSPHSDSAIAAWALEAGIAYVPGGFTATEIVSAWRFGVAAVKLFPASVGPAYVRAVTAPLPAIPLVVTGGVNGDNLGEFFAAGVRYAGIGGWLVDHTDLNIVAARAAEVASIGRAASS